MSSDLREQEPLLPMNYRRHAKVHAASDDDPVRTSNRSTRPDKLLPSRTAQTLAALGAAALVLGAVVVPRAVLSPSKLPAVEHSAPLSTPALADVDARDHMRAMHDACVMHDQAIIPWRVGLPRGAVAGERGGDEEDQETTDAKRVLHRQDPRVLGELRRCPDVDIYLPSEPRGLGYCEDGSAFATCASL